MFLIGAFFGAWLADNERYHNHEVVGGMGGFGILAGLIAGNIHGAINGVKSGANHGWWNA